MPSVTLAAVQDQMAAAINSIGGVYAVDHAADHVTPPAVVLTLPDTIRPRAAYKGSAQIIEDLAAVLLLARNDIGMATADLSPWVAASGPGSLLDVVESWSGWAAIGVHDVTCTRIEFEQQVTYAGVPYVSAVFYFKIIGDR